VLAGLLGQRASLDALLGGTHETSCTACR
jgi:hypothetical protein